MRDLGFLTGHVTFKLRYNQIYQLKTTTLEKVLCFFLVAQKQPFQKTLTIFLH